METGNVMWMPCTIENSGFSSERCYSVDLGDNGSIEGTANIMYLRDDEDRPIEEGVPSYDQSIRGKVMCRIIRQSNKEKVVEFPGTAVRHIPQDALQPET